MQFLGRVDLGRVGGRRQADLPLRAAVPEERFRRVRHAQRRQRYRPRKRKHHLHLLFSFIRDDLNTSLCTA